MGGLLGAVRALVGDEVSESHCLMGEDLVVVTGPMLAAAAADYQAGLARLPAELRPAFEAEQQALLVEARSWLRRYNRSVHGRIEGYRALGERCDFAYPWPVVAILGVCQVQQGMLRAHGWALAGAAAARVGSTGLERLAEMTDDVLRRTNRGIFADSVPTVLWALRADALRRSGSTELAEALLDGPLPVVFDERSRRLARGLYDGLAVAGADARFRRLAALTLDHFSREQAIFSHHLGVAAGKAPRPARSWLGRLVQLSSVPAPAIERSASGRRLVFRPFPLPPAFDMRDHAARVTLFGQAFVRSVTDDRDDYATAVDFVRRRFGRG